VRDAEESPENAPRVVMARKNTASRRKKGQGARGVGLTGGKRTVGERKWESKRDTGAGKKEEGADPSGSVHQ